MNASRGGMHEGWRWGGVAFGCLPNSPACSSPCSRPNIQVSYFVGSCVLNPRANHWRQRDRQETKLVARQYHTFFLSRPVNRPNVGLMYGSCWNSNYTHLSAYASTGGMQGSCRFSYNIPRKPRNQNVSCVLMILFIWIRVLSMWLLRIQRGV